MTNTTGISFEKRTLSIPLDGYKFEQLNNGKTLSDYKIQKQTIIYLHTTGKMQVFVKTMKGKIFPFAVEDSDTIESLKDKISEREG